MSIIESEGGIWPPPPSPEIPQQELEQPEEQESEAPEVKYQFPAKWQEEFEGLLYLGHLEKEVRIRTHRFVVRTLTVGEKIEVSRITRDLQGVTGYNRAYKAAVVAAGLKTVDGKTILVAEKNPSYPPVRDKYEYIVNGWYDTVVQILYDAINDLELQSVKLMFEMGIVKVPPVVLTQVNEAVERTEQQQ